MLAFGFWFIVLSAAASPLQNSGQFRAGSFVRKINRSFRQDSPVANKTGALRIFDPMYAVRAWLQNLCRKSS
jgi:hypothetical protein